MTDTSPRQAEAQHYLDELQAERDATWTEQRLTAHAALRQALENDADRAGFIKVGEVMPDFVLDEVDGGIASLPQLLRKGPVVLLFFRFEGCPACNAALQGYQESLAAPLAGLGAQLVAVSAQVPHLLRAVKRRHGLSFAVASDPEAGLIRRLGIGFAPDDAARQAAVAAGNDLGATLGTGDWTLPYPTAIVIDTAGVVRYVDVHPDWMVRTSSAEIIEEVARLTP